MNSTLEFNETPCTYVPRMGEVFQLSDGMPVMAGQTLTLCAWCDHRHVLFTQLNSAGYLVTSSICESCAKNLRAEYEKLAKLDS